MFTLYAPLASWGEIAVGEIRGSWDRPSRSAVLGLIAAALGIKREQQDLHDALREYGVAVRLDAVGTPLSDYHTAQSRALERKEIPSTRARLLDRPAHELQTILSRRMYRQDAVATVVLWARVSARWSLDDLSSALRNPVFVLFAGRKSNVLGAPLDPEIVSKETLADALVVRPGIPRGIAFGIPGVRLMWEREVSHDPIIASDGFQSGLRPSRYDIRRDVSTHRTKWLFAERRVETGFIPESLTVSRGVE
ncbi:MAG: type I-E CRISPR-associated protein Cas5/CasD [Gemmatimonadota bacterium]|jgi:CRISPR system Cascade subunit CasD|nr:type I-E CRISPR-associated protein Cas5/CasD [Gemmatimonadota bacterium]